MTCTGDIGAAAAAANVVDGDADTDVDDGDADNDGDHGDADVDDDSDDSAYVHRAVESFRAMKKQ